MAGLKLLTLRAVLFTGQFRGQGSKLKGSESFLALPGPESLTILQGPSCIFLSFLWFSPPWSQKLRFKSLLCQ